MPHLQSQLNHIEDFAISDLICGMACPGRSDIYFVEPDDEIDAVLREAGLDFDTN
jgi:hypothetical protein